MARILEFREIPLADLVIGRGQVRTQSVGQELEDLVQSIKCQGLLQPIVVCRSEESGKWQILVGQRRFLAFNRLRADTIPAAVLDGPVSPHEAKAAPSRLYRLDFSYSTSILRSQADVWSDTDQQIWSNFGNQKAGYTRV